MSVKSVMKSFSFAKAAGLCALGLGLVLGGCNNKLKDENAALMSQNQALIAENNELKTSRDAMQSQITDLQKTQQTARAPESNYVDNSGGSGPVGRRGPGGGGGSRGGGEDIFVVAGDVLFDPGQATIKAGAKKELDKIASKIKSEHSGQSIRVEGYTDSDPLNKTKAKWGSNEGLSEARAEAVRKYLISKGVSSGRISAVGMGAAKPKATKKDSRRVEIVVLAQ